MRRLVTLLTLLLAFAPLVALAQEGTPEAETATSLTTPERTDVRLLLPFGRDGLSAELVETESVSGNCSDDSLSVPGRPDAWECIGADDQIYDPCFENPFVAIDAPGVLACVASPFVNEVVLLTLDEPLLREKENLADAGVDAWSLPWALELANGERCVLLSDIDVVLAGLAVHYLCADGGSILGNVNRGDPVWTVGYAANGASSSTLIDVVAAWS